MRAPLGIATTLAVGVTLLGVLFGRRARRVWLRLCQPWRLELRPAPLASRQPATASDTDAHVGQDASAEAASSAAAFPPRVLHSQSLRRSQLSLDALLAAQQGQTLDELLDDETGEEGGEGDGAEASLDALLEESDGSDENECLPAAAPQNGTAPRFRAASLPPTEGSSRGSSPRSGRPSMKAFGASRLSRTSGDVRRAGARQSVEPAASGAAPPRLKRSRTAPLSRTETARAEFRAAAWSLDTQIERKVRDRRSNPAALLSSLRRVAGLGVGNFGRVALVQDVRGRAFALKQVWKGQLLAQGHVAHALAERELLGLVDHPFVVKLERAFHDARSVYFLMEPVLGGELYSLLHVLGRFAEGQARFYAACIVAAFDHLHALRIVYRDLKPENLLLDGQGYLKLVDFGLATRLEPGGHATSLIGTPEYLAPEVLRAEPYGTAVDWWSTGMLLFEMLGGAPAFRGETKQEVFAKILNDAPRMLAPVSAACAELLDGLLDKQPAARTGSGGAAEVRASAFFAGVDWGRLEARAEAAPYVPRIADELDTSNVVNVDKYAAPADGVDGETWDRALEAGTLRTGADPFASFGALSSDARACG